MELMSREERERERDKRIMKRKLFVCFDTEVKSQIINPSGHPETQDIEFSSI